MGKREQIAAKIAQKAKDKESVKQPVVFEVVPNYEKAGHAVRCRCLMCEARRVK